jgi:tetratricopeptide (TPR) repeat protein
LVHEDNPGAKAKAAAALANLTLARSFRRNLEWGQAIPLYEAYILENPNSPELPTTLLELGRTYAQAGANEAALSRFYSVLDLAVNQEGASLTQGREVAYSAQYEIAQTQMALGRYAQAARLFRGMRKLPLIDVDRANIYLSCGRALKLAGDKPGAAEEYEALLQSFSDSPVAPEARFELAVVYAELGRRDDALREVLSLFERQKSSGSSDETWRYWQRRAGNQLANMFYSTGNLPEAAELYGKLLQLSGDARWRWPLLYQVGLVAEQMKDFAKAKVTYTELAAAKAEGLSAEVAELPKLAQWRLEHLKWAERMDAELNSLKPSA